MTRRVVLPYGGAEFPTAEQRAATRARLEAARASVDWARDFAHGELDALYAHVRVPCVHRGTLGYAAGWTAGFARRVAERGA